MVSHRSNDIRIKTKVGDRLVSNFALWEFENQDGWVMIQPLTIKTLELTRAELNVRSTSGEVQIIITGSTRTQEQNERLAYRLGWTTNGGLVSPTSRHLARYGGDAVDFFARYAHNKKLVPLEEVANVARHYFDSVFIYMTSRHIHGDNRQKLSQ